MNTQINITENGTTTLATAGKYCDRNIDVNVEVAGGAVNDADGILDGTFSGAYYSDKLTSLKERAFASMGNVTGVSLPNCTTFEGESTFNSTENLTSVYLPNLTTIVDGKYTFARTKLTEVDLPNLTSVTGTAFFYNTTRLKTVKLKKLSGNTIGASWFNLSKIEALVLGGNELNPLDNTNAFTNSPIAKGEGYIYVPDNLVDAYKTATNWVTFADQIKPMSELEG